jgi:hypothetical protein
MEAIKQILRVKDDKITIHLDPKMNNTQVEVIILPFSPRKVNKEIRNSGLKDLLSIGVWSDTDIKAMEDASQKFNLWTIQSF